MVLTIICIYLKYIIFMVKKNNNTNYDISWKFSGSWKYLFKKNLNKLANKYKNINIYQDLNLYKSFSIIFLHFPFYFLVLP